MPEIVPLVFRNYLTQTDETECAEERNGRWFIKMGFAGFNSRANNRNGYKRKIDAECACLSHQVKGT